MTQAFLTQTDFSAGEPQTSSARLYSISGPTRAVRRGCATSWSRPPAACAGGLVTSPRRQRQRAGPPGGEMETGPDQAYLLAFADFQVKIFRNSVLRANVATPWRRRS